MPSVLPTPPPGRGLTAEQRLRRAVSRALAAAGYTEVINYPFVAPRSTTRSGLAADDPRRRALRLANPLSDAEPELRTTLLPGLLANLARNIGRGTRDLALFEMGLVFLPPDGAGAGAAARGRRTGRPTRSWRRSMRTRARRSRGTSPPCSPASSSCRLVGPGPAGRLGRRDRGGPGGRARGPGRAGRSAQADRAPWHPGPVRRAAAGRRGRRVRRRAAPAGDRGAGPAARAPARWNWTSTRSPPPAPAQAPVLSGFPPVLLDLALVVR